MRRAFTTACALAVSAALTTANAQFSVEQRVHFDTSIPGSAGGSGAFDMHATGPPTCGQYDDGTTEGSLGLVNGGETGWMHSFDCFMKIDEVSTAYGTIGGTAVPNGNPSRIAVYEDADCDGDPTTGPPVLLWSVTTITMQTGTDLLIAYPTGGLLVPSRCSWIMATAAHAAAEFPAPMDTTNPTPAAWVVGASPTGSTLDLSDLNSNSVPPLQTTVAGFPTAWLLQASGVESPPPIRPPASAPVVAHVATTVTARGVARTVLTSGARS